MKYLTWAILWLPMFLIGIVFRIFSPIACLFVVRQPYTTTVKRYGRQTLTLQRDRLVWWLSWFDTFDNATDEYFYGVYPFAENVTQAEYDNSKWLQYKFRVLWLQRNSAYGLANTKLFSLPKGKGFQLKGTHWLPFGYHNDYNIGWKAHKNIERLSYAGRIIGIRKNAN